MSAMLRGSAAEVASGTNSLLQHACVPHCRQGQRRRESWKAFAMASRQANKQPARQSRKRGELPDSGFFAQADPKAEVYILRKGQDTTDVTKRGGRYTSDFVWNTNWQQQLDNQKEMEERQQAEAAEGPQQSNGGLSFSRVSDLQSLQHDLTTELREARVKAEQRMQATMAAAAAAAARSQQADVPPTQGEARRWLRSGRYSRKAVATPTEQETVALAAEAAAEQERYDVLKAQLQAWCLSTALVCFLATLAFYSKDTATSYGFGAIGSMLYLRMLNRSIDSVGGFSVGAALGQPRLLVPIILTATFNRWNTLAAEDTGITLQLLPMLLGFFTYKAAVIAQGALSLLENLAANGATAAEKTTEDLQAADANAAYMQHVLTK